MSRVARAELSAERKKQIDAGEVELMSAQEAAYYLKYNDVRSIRKLYLNDRTFRAGKPFFGPASKKSQKSEIYVLRSKLLEWLTTPTPQPVNT
jgi:hypothetical protein